MTEVSDWSMLHTALSNLLKAARLAADNISEFGRVTDGETVDMLDNAIDHAAMALDFALKRHPSNGERIGQLVSEALALAPKAGLFLEITIKEAVSHD